jgi:flavodoxin short chain
MKKIAIIFWSGTGNTKLMAEALAQGAESANVSVDLFDISQNKPETLEVYDGLLLGCPSMGAEVLEESEFEPYYDGIKQALQGKPVGLFGSYGWGNGEWLQDWEDDVEAVGAKLFETGLMVNETPDDEAIATCEAFAKRFVTS